jgi:endonuclease/exonuclease/phosphatase family metal-dependent hydrolase
MVHQNADTLLRHGQGKSIMTVKPHHKTPAWLLTLIFAYLAILAALSVMNQIGADRWWFGALNLYLPQVIWAGPGILIAALTLRVAWRWVWMPLLGIVWAAGPLMGFCWPVHTSQVPHDSYPLRVMTWNVKYGSHDKLAHMAIMYEIDRNKPAVVLLQDAGGVLNGLLGDYFCTWNVRSDGQYIIASRLPLSALQIKRISFPGEEHTCVRSELQFNGTKVILYNAHLQSPREGLNALRVVRKNPRILPDAIQQLELNVKARLIQAGILREYLRQETGPVIIAGDLNSPDASQVCAVLRDADLHDAFAEGGKGYGYTYGHFLFQNKLPDLNVSWMRIDHIMMSSQFQSRNCWTGTGKASDHRPVIADLILFH